MFFDITIPGKINIGNTTTLKKIVLKSSSWFVDHAGDDKGYILSDCLQLPQYSGFFSF